LCCPNILLPIHLRSTAGNACLSACIFSFVSARLLVIMTLRFS
jgi:hypothetical protein